MQTPLFQMLNPDRCRPRYSKCLFRTAVSGNLLFQMLNPDSCFGKLWRARSSLGCMVQRRTSGQLQTPLFQILNPDRCRPRYSKCLIRTAVSGNFGGLVPSLGCKTAPCTNARRHNQCVQSEIGDLKNMKLRSGPKNYYHTAEEKHSNQKRKQRRIALRVQYNRKHEYDTIETSFKSS